MEELPAQARPRLLERLSALLMRKPEDREQLIALLHSARERDLLDAEALAMIEGVLQTSELSASDIMVPRARMDVSTAQALEAILRPYCRRRWHSSF